MRLILFLSTFLVSGLAQAGEVAAYYDGEMPVASIPADNLDYILYAFGEPDDKGLCAAPSPDQRAAFAQLRH